MVEGSATASGPALDAACAPRARAVPGDGTSRPVIPCGLVAWSAFNDTFRVSDAGALPTPLALDETGIAVPGDGAARFGNGSVWASPGHNDDPQSRGGRPAGRAGAFVVPLSADEHLQVWMRPAALPAFRKLWGVVRGGDGGDRATPVLPAGTVLQVTVENRFNSHSPGGSKAVVLTTASWLGGANAFTGWALVGTGGAAAVAAAGLAGLGWARGRRGGRGRVAQGGWEM